MLEMNSSRDWEQGMVHPSQGMSFGSEHNSGSLSSPLLSLFEAQLAKNPDAIVFKKGNFCMSYRELDSRSRKLWHFLSRNYDIRTDDHIALIWDRNEHLLPMLLGIIRSEGILLPIHPDTSQENMILMMAEYKCRTILDGSFMNSLEWSENSFGELPPLNHQQEGRIIFQLHNQQDFSRTSTLSLCDLEMALATLKLHLPETTGDLLQLNRNNLAAGLIECLYPVFYGGCLVLPEYENPHLPETMFPLQSPTGPNCLLADQQHMAALESGRLKFPDHWKKTRIFVSGNIHENCKLENFYNHSTKAINEDDRHGSSTIKKQISLSGDETSYTFTSDNKKSSQQEHIGLETSLSVYQLSIWNAQKKSSTPAVFLRNYQIQLNGILDLDQFIHSHELLLQKQEILRTLIQEHPGGIVKQKIASGNHPQFQIEIIKLSENTDLQAINNIKLDFFTSSKAWENRPLARFKLIQTGTQSHVLLVSLHHIISDEESCGILLKQWGQFYHPGSSSIENFITSKPFIQLVISEKRALETGVLSRQKLFWADRLSGIVQPVHLLSDYEDPLIRTYEGKMVSKTMDQDFLDTLHHLGRYHGGNLHTSLLALTKVLLFLHTGLEDFIVGTDSPGRLDPANHNRVGPYNSALPIRSIFRQNDSWDSFHMELIRNLKDSYQHMDYPLSAGLETGNNSADSSRMQLYNVYVSVREDCRQFNFGDTLEVSLLQEEICTTKMDLHFNFLHGNNHLTLQLLYNKQLYPEIQMERLLLFFQRLVPQIKQKPGTAFHSLELLSRDEKNQQLEQFNNSQEVPHLAYTSLVQQFEHHAATSGERPALHYRDKQLSYNELNKWSNKLSHYLINQHHVIPDEPICVKLERSDWNIVTLIAVLKSGAGYLPIEYNSSADKTEYMFQDSGSKMLIEEEFMVEFLQQAESMEDYNPELEISPDQLACCIYPMHEKGLPKAVMLDHAALSLRMRSLWMELDFKDNEKIMQAGLFGSEMFQTEFLLTLSNGGCLCLLDSEYLQNPQKTVAYILDKKIETIFFKPSFLTVFLNWLETNTTQKPELETLLKRIVTCGHPVPTKMTRQWQGKITTRIYNLFGSAETSFIAAASITDHLALRSRIGKPLKFSRIVLLDRFNNLPPLGAAGEICIGGQSLARCYMNSPEKNRKHFIGNPYKPGEKLFRTGQLGRWNESGELEYLGMIEEELEMKGHKIDPDDIKAALLNCEGVHAAIVQLRENKDGKKEIIAFIGGLSDETAVMEEFKQRFPAQLCPDWIVKMNHLPVTSSRRIRY